MPLPNLTKRSRPTSASRSLIWRDSAGCARRSRSDALLSDPDSATSMKVRRRFRSMKELPALCTEAVEAELAAAARLDELGVGRRIGIEGSHAAAVALRRLAQRGGELAQRPAVMDGSQRGQVAVVGGLRDLRASMQVGDALAQTT